MPSPELPDLSREACDLRLYDALVAITEHPERWDQADWADPERDDVPGNGWPCGTAACLAGTAIIRADLYTIARPGDPEAVEWPTIDISDTGRAIGQTWSELGQALLGLSRFQAESMFNGCNTLSQLWEMAAEFTEGRVQVPADLTAKVAAIDAERAFSY